MSKRTIFTTITPLPEGVTRQTVMDTLHSHLEMIDLNPLVEERHPVKPPADATPEEFHCLWYSITDRVSYMPGGLLTGKVTFNVCFHDLDDGLQTHCYAPAGLNIKAKWSLGGSLPGEPAAPVELGIGAPLSGLYLREDVDMKCNIVMTTFVKKTLKAAHARLVDRLVAKAQFEDATIRQERLRSQNTTTEYPSSDYGNTVRDDSVHLVSDHFTAPHLPMISSSVPDFDTQRSPSNRNHAMDELHMHMTLDNASPTYQAYVKAPASLELPSNEHRRGSGTGQTRNETYANMPTVYGAAELA